MGVARNIALWLILLGYAMLGAVGARTNMALQWPSYILFGVAALVAIVLIWNRTRLTPSRWCLISTGTLTLYVVVRAAASPVPHFARMEVAMVLAAAIVYLLFSLHLVRTGYRLAFVGLLMLLSLGNLGVGIYQITQEISYLILPGYSRTQSSGAGGFYDNHNHLGGFLVIAASFSLALALFGRTGIVWRVVCGSAFLVSMSGIAITASRGTYLSISFCLLFLLVAGLLLARKLYERELRKIVVAVAAILVLAVGVTAVWGVKALGERFDSSDPGEIARGLLLGGDVRMKGWELAIDQWGEFPLIGQGARMYDFYSVQHWPERISGVVHAEPEFVHNDYLQMLGEYGVVGMALIVFFILTHFIAGLRYLRWFLREGFSGFWESSNSLLALVLGSMGLLCGYAVHSVFDFNLHLPANLIPVSFAFAILSNLPTSRRASPPLALAGKLALPLAGGILLAAAFAFARGEWQTEKARLVGVEDYAQVLALTEKAIEYDPTHFEAHRLRGTAIMLFGFDFDIESLRGEFARRAVGSFEEAYAAHPYDAFSLVGLGRCLSEMGEYERADEVFAKAVALTPWRRETRLRSGYHHLHWGMHLVLDDLDGAIAQFEEAKLEMLMARRSHGGSRDEVVLAGSNSVFAMLSGSYKEQALRYLDSAGGAQDAGARREYLMAARDSYSRAMENVPRDQKEERAFFAGQIADIDRRLRQLPE